MAKKRWIAISLKVASHAADLMLFDPARVGRGKNFRVNDLPAGATRLESPALGVHGVWINGVRVVDPHGAFMGRHTPGKVLREFAH